MEASFVRTSTEDEINYLKMRLKESLSPRKRMLKAILNTLVMWGGGVFILFFISSILSHFIQINHLFNSSSTFLYFDELSMLIATLFALFNTYKWVVGVDGAYPLILKDIQDSKICEDTYHIIDVYRFQAPQEDGFIYFLKVAENKIFVLYDYQRTGSIDIGLAIKKLLVLNRTIHSNLCVSYNLKGESINVSATYPLIISSEKWPLPNTWLSMTWPEVKSAFIH